jgi:hypothetical protein
MSDDDLRTRVFRSNDQAVENGYAIGTWPVDQIVTDLLDCDSAFEGMTSEQVRPHCEAWLVTRGYMCHE